MICYVDLEHPERGPSILTEGPEATQRKADILTFKARFERLSGAPCLLLHFTQVDRALLERVGVRAVIVSGHSTLIDDYDPRTLAPLVELIRETPDPVLGLCGGHQLIGLAVRLATSEACPIQAIRHGSRPLYGVQFHPERYSKRHPAGRTILANFFRLAGFPALRSEAAALARA